MREWTVVMNRKWSTLAILFLLALLYGLYEWSSPPKGSAAESPERSSADSRSARGGDRAILNAFAEQRSGIMVESAGTVERTLSDDLEGSRHQRFIIRLEAGHTLLVSHNIDIAPRIPLAEQDLVEFRGQYEWNERGGVVHWTHHDPNGTHPGGWIRYRGKLFD